MDSDLDTLNDHSRVKNVVGDLLRERLNEIVIVFDETSDDFNDLDIIDGIIEVVGLP